MRLAVLVDEDRQREQDERNRHAVNPHHDPSTAAADESPGNAARRNMKAMEAQLLADARAGR